MALAIPIPDKLLSFLMEKVVPVLQAETQKFQSVHELLDDIKNEMDIAKDYLKKAEVKVDRTNDQTKEQLKKLSNLRALVFKVEDIIDDYKLLESTHQIGNQQEDGKGCLVGIWKLLDRGSKEVDGFKDKRGIACSIEELGLILRDPGHCPLYKDEEDFVGFKNRQSKVIEKLDLQNKIYGKGQFVLAVWGQPGLGKTTLVQKVYEKENVRKHFSCYAWITATKPYKKMDLLKCLAKQFITSSNAAVVDDESASCLKGLLQDNGVSEVVIVDGLRNYLQKNHPKNRYLVVIDDVSEMEELSKIIKATLVPSCSEGGRILMTTKSERIANYWKTSSSYGEAYNLQVLSEQDAKVLFNKKAFGNQGKCPRKLKSLRDTIVKECDGLPFLIEKVGANFSTTHKWIELYHDFQINPVSPSWSREVLLLSGYHEMPYHLKPCFLYLCMFPKGCKFKRMRIVRLWLAEGFVEAKDHNTREEAAEEYLNELVERGMILKQNVKT
uniref:Uncharacterized protein n=1 Tax=Chenopodium quinoa TaxID=63459 RepID=A0A803MN68_CHEQI